MTPPARPGSRPDVRPALRPDLRLVPATAAAWVGAWVGTLGTGRTAGLAVVGAVALLGLLLAVLRRGPAWVAVSAAVLVAAGAGTLQHRALGGGPLGDLVRQRAVVSATAVIRTDPVLVPAAGRRPAYVSVRVRLLEVVGRGSRWRLRAPVLLSAGGTDAVALQRTRVGETVEVIGRLEPPLPGDDLAAVLRARSAPLPRAPPGPAAKAVDRVRAGLRVAVVHRRPDVRALVPALVVGDTAAMTPELEERFTATGLTHLTAVSGANLTLLLAFVLVAARWAGVRGWWLRVVALLGVVAFVALCRAEPSVLRAAAMGLVALAALGLGGGRAAARQLCVAAFALLLVDPFLARSYGFALSVLATGGIVAWSRRWTAAARRWLPRVVAEALSVPLAAQVATAPVVAQLSGSVSVVGLLANALVGPFVGPATVAGLAAAGLSVTSPRLAAIAGFVAAWCAQPIVWIANIGSRLPGATLRWPATPPALVVLGVVCLAVAASMTAVLSRRWLVLPLAAVLVACLLRPPLQPGWPPRGWLFVACGVGQGDALVVRIGPRQAAVVDAGPDPRALTRCLAALGVRRVPLVVLSHFHADHIGGLDALAEFGVQEVWVSPLASPPLEAARVGTWAAGQGARLRVPTPGTLASLGNSDWSVLGPRAVPATPAGGAARTDEASDVENDESLVLRVSVDGVRLLLTGDVELTGQSRLVRDGADLGADVLKVPHHGSAQQDPAFFAATGARFAVASMGAHNDYGHPAARTIALARTYGMAFFRTDRQGGVAVARVLDRLVVVTELPG